MDESTAVSPRCRKCGRDLGSSFLYSGDGFTYHSECFPVSPLNAEIEALRTALSQEREAREKAEKDAEQARIELGEAMLVVEQQDLDSEGLRAACGDLLASLDPDTLNPEQFNAWSAVSRFLSQEPNHER